MKKLLLGLSVICAQSFAAPLNLNFEEIKSANDVFGIKEPGRAVVLNSYMPYAEWSEKHSGRYFPMEVSPVLAGMVRGGVSLPAPQRVEPSQYHDQAREFAEVVNTRNAGGRPTLPASPLTPQKRYAEDQANTYVVQTILATVITRPLSQLKLNAENFAAVIENADLDHYHFRIPGSFVLQALESNHIAAASIQPSSAYLLSVIDFRQYFCAAMKDGLRDYFAKEDAKKKLINESMYLISDLTLNAPADLAAAEKMFGKKADAVLGQQVVFADRLIRGARTLFVFFTEGSNTRVVLVSNIAMQKKHFTGTTGMAARGVILHGMNGSAVGSIAVTKSNLGSLLTGANQDIRSKNACERGLAKGLIRYSQGLFGELLGGL